LIGPVFPILPEAGNASKENSVRMRRYNRDLALFLYTGQAAPQRPYLLEGDGTEQEYVPSAGLRTEGPEQSGVDPPVGDGPDEHGYYAVTDPGWGLGALYHHPKGGVFARLEAPAPDGSFRPVWIRIT